MFCCRRADLLAKRFGRSASCSSPISAGARSFGGLKSDQVKRLKDLEKENERPRKAVSDLMLEKLILREAASGNY
jgi:hypothetical protein